MKYLIVGLGNIGPGYQDTRHNIGFGVLDAFAKASNAVFESKRYGAVCETKVQGRTLVLLKPNTYMNLSGNAVRYWVQREKIIPERLLVIVDDLALPFGTLRLRCQGGDGGHNGLKSINTLLETINYARLRFGIGNEFSKGHQVNYVLGKWHPEEKEKLPALLEHCGKIITNFILLGGTRTMSMYNGDFLEPK